MRFTEFQPRFLGSARTKNIRGACNRKLVWPVRAAFQLLAKLGYVRRKDRRPYDLPPVRGLPPEYIRLDPWEVEYLFSVAQRATRGILEIGRRHGGSTFVLACANPRAPIHSIDIEPRDDDRLRRLYQQHGVGENVTLLVGDSQNRRFPQVSAFDVLFIDGDHSYEGCTRDLENWFPRLATGGHVVLHDCFAGTQVQEAVLDFAAKHDVEEVRSPAIGREPWRYEAGSLAHLQKR